MCDSDIQVNGVTAKLPTKLAKNLSFTAFFKGETGLTDYVITRKEKK
jgi:hypothetical protein